MDDAIIIELLGRDPVSDPLTDLFRKAARARDASQTWQGRQAHLKRRKPHTRRTSCSNEASENRVA